MTANTTGDQNTAIGGNCLDSNTTGGANTGVGRNCLESNTTGQYNVGVGFNGLQGNTTGSNNVALGFQALDDNTTADNNTAVGYRSLYLSSTGAENVAMGKESGYNVTTGSHNTLIGREAGHNLTTGSNNLFLGKRAGTASSPSGIQQTGGDTVCLGDNGIQSFFCADTSISSSDSRDKTDVTSFNVGLAWIEALRPVTYRWDRRTWYGTDAEPFGTPDGSKKRQKLHIGFLAQEALEVEKANGYGSSNDNSLIVNLTEDGMSYGMKYERLVPILVNAIKELSAKVTALEAG